MNMNVWSVEISLSNLYFQALNGFIAQNVKAERCKKNSLPLDLRVEKSLTLLRALPAIPVQAATVPHADKIVFNNFKFNFCNTIAFSKE